MVCGYLYLLPTLGYSEKEAKKGRIIRDEHFNWEKYLRSFALLADRKDAEDISYKYEEICLLAVDFSKREPKILLNIDDFENRKLVTEKFAKNFDYGTLNIDSFIDRLLKKFRDRNLADLSR